MRTGEVLASELYDETEDPMETRNRVGEASLASVVVASKSLLAARVGASAPGAAMRLALPVP